VMDGLINLLRPGFTLWALGTRPTALQLWTSVSKRMDSLRGIVQVA
jgi:hypothetical protein